MKKVIIPLILSVILSLTGCNSTPIKGNAARQEEQGRNRIAGVEAKQTLNTNDKLNTIASLSYGTDYALSKVLFPTREIDIARDMNQRVMSLSGNPAIDKMKEMQVMIDNLTSEVKKEQTEGKKKLDAKDIEITKLQEETKTLAIQKDTEIQKYIKLAKDAAERSDGYIEELNEYKGWFGLKAIGKGLTQFIKSAFWILTISGVLFLILRIIAYSNPIAASIFSIFDTIGSWIINFIKIIIPKAVERAGHTTNTVLDLYKNTLKKLVDSVQIVKERAKAAGTTATLESVLDEADKSMDSEEKSVIKDIKKSLNWKT